MFSLIMFSSEINWKYSGKPKQEALELKKNIFIQDLHYFLSMIVIIDNLSSFYVLVFAGDFFETIFQ